jgi:hypothetical protein
LNATPPIQPEDAADRTARHMRMLAELEELGMQLARATAARALADLAQPEASEVQEAAPQSEPLAQVPLQEAVQAPTPRSAPARPPGTTARKSTDPVQSFLRLAAAVCACIALEARLSLGPVTTGSRLVPPALRADPRREPLIKTFREITEHTQDRAGLRAEFTARVDEELTADPDQILSLPELFFPLCDEMGIEPDVKKLPDAIIGMDPCTTYDPNPEISDDDPDFNPIPRATSPP